MCAKENWFICLMDLIENYRLGEIHFNNKRAAMDTDYTGTCKWLFRSARIGVSNYIQGSQNYDAFH